MVIWPVFIKAAVAAVVAMGLINGGFSSPDGASVSDLSRFDLNTIYRMAIFPENLDKQLDDGWQKYRDAIMAYRSQVISSHQSETAREAFGEVFTTKLWRSAGVNFNEKYLVNYGVNLDMQVPQFLENPGLAAALLGRTIELCNSGELDCSEN